MQWLETEPAGGVGFFVGCDETGQFDQIHIPDIGVVSRATYETVFTVQPYAPKSKPGRIAQIFSRLRKTRHL